MVKPDRGRHQEGPRYGRITARSRGHGRHGLLAAEAPQKVEAVTPTVQLLQAYDEYIMGYSESRSVLDVSGVTELPCRSNVAFNHVIILDSQLAGHWKAP